MKGRRWSWLLGAWAVCASCSAGSGEDAPRAVVRDSAGITIVENPALDGAVQLVAWGADGTAPTPAVGIGMLEGPEEYQFFRVSAIRALSDGGIAVANGGSREVRINVLAGDTLEVQDFLDRVYFAPDGTFLRRTTFDRGAFTALWEPGGGMSEGGQWVPGGTLFAPVYHWDRNPPVAGPLYRPQMTLVRMSADFGTIDTLGVFGGILQQYVDVGGELGGGARADHLRRGRALEGPTADGVMGEQPVARVGTGVGEDGHPRIQDLLRDGSRGLRR